MRTLINLGSVETPEKLMKEVRHRNSISPGKSYATYPPDMATPEKLATEISAVWHGQATALDGVRCLFGADISTAISELLGAYYLIYVLKLTSAEATNFLNHTTDAYRLGKARQSWLANSGDREALKEMWFDGTVDWDRVSNFIPDYLSFWQKYYDIFGGRRESDLTFLAKCGFDAVNRWLWIFTSTNLHCGIILSSLHNDIVRIK